MAYAAEEKSKQKNAFMDIKYIKLHNIKAVSCTLFSASVFLFGLFIFHVTLAHQEDCEQL